MLAGNPLERKRDREIEENSPRRKKTAVLFLVIFTIVIVALAILQFQTKLNAPFAIGTKKTTTDNATTTDLTKKDSDNDGLSDADEINIYKTSPYLPDSDSDGISDKDEITAGTDPNCPAGKTCETADTAVSETSSSTASTTVDAAASAIGAEAISTNGEVTPDFLRQILIENGSDTSTVNQISDEDIMAAYQEAVSSQASSTNQ